jgi:hypothetical protein
VGSLYGGLVDSRIRESISVDLFGLGTSADLSYDIIVAFERLATFVRSSKRREEFQV